VNVMLKIFSKLPIVLLFWTLVASTHAQQSTQESPENPIVTPIPGRLAFWTTSGLTVLDTFDGSWKIVPDAGGEPNWDPAGRYLAAVSDEEKLTQFFDINSLEVHTLTFEQDTRSSSFSESRRIAGWSADSQEIMYLIRVFSGQRRNYGTAGYRLEIMNVDTGAVKVVLETPPQMMMNTLFPVPEDSKEVVLHLINEVRWNPIYTEWMLIELVGVGKRVSTGEEIGVYETGLYNHVTRQYISLQTLFPQTVISFTDWSADGRKIALNTMTGVNIVSFTLQDGNPVLKIIADSIDSKDQAVLQWLGTGDLIVTGTTLPYRTTFIAQVINNQWYSAEFIALASFSPEYAGGNRDFFLTADSEERNRLSCRFFDQVFPSRLKTGQRGQVAFTDGTPSRLRAKPGTDGEVLTQLSEGTSFDIVGSAYCVDDYRWWQVRLKDGTTGWVAEGNQPDYWLEPSAEE
jgi:hypothetical protein